MLRPRFLPLLDEATQEDIIISVQRLIAVLGSEEVALDGRHTPALYSRFLASLLAKHDVTHHQNLESPSDKMRIYPQYGEDRQHTPNVYWPDTLTRDTSLHAHRGDSSQLVYQQPGDADMDLSVLHFGEG